MQYTTYVQCCHRLLHTDNIVQYIPTTTYWAIHRYQTLVCPWKYSMSVRQSSSLTLRHPSRRWANCSHYKCEKTSKICATIDAIEREKEPRGQWRYMSSGMTTKSKPWNDPILSKQPH